MNHHKSQTNLNNSLINSLFPWILAFLWLVLIFSLSAQPANDSNELSMKLTQVLVAIVRGLGLLNEGDPDFYAKIAQLNGVLRQLTHFGVYFVLGFLVMNAAAKRRAFKPRLIVLSFVFCVVYALSDELHQTFVPGRSGSWIDVAVDSLGALAGILLWRLIGLFRRQK